MKRTADGTTSRTPVWLNAALLLITSFAALAVLSLRVPADAEVVAVVFPPWWTSQQIFEAAAAADAAVVRTTAIATVLVVRPNDHDGMARLHQAGAWLALDPRAIAACIDTSARGIKI